MYPHSWVSRGTRYDLAEIRDFYKIYSVKYSWTATLYSHPNADVQHGCDLVTDNVAMLYNFMPYYEKHVPRRTAAAQPMLPQLEPLNATASDAPEPNEVKRRTYYDENGNALAHGSLEEGLAMFAEFQKRNGLTTK